MRAGGSFYHYVRENSTTFSSITARIKEGYYAARGVKILTIYCPYKATEEWSGVPALDFFSTNPNTGSIADFEAMTAAAHENGMAVIMYAGLLFVDEKNPTWLKADKDHANGVDSPEASIFRFAANHDGEVPEFGSWMESEQGGFFAASWNHPAIDIGREPGRKYVESVIKFWLDKGVDGFEYDAPGGFWGGTPSLLKQLLVDLPQNYDKTRPKYLIGEGHYAAASNEKANNTVGFTHVLLSGDSDDRSVATDVMNGTSSVDALEQHFARYVDARRAAGRGVRSVSLYDLDMTPAERALEAAVLAGNGSYMEIDHDSVYSEMSAEHQRQYDTVFKALASSAAEAPGAGRKRLTTGNSDSMEYAVLRTSPTGMERAVNVYNFENAPATVVVNLAGSGIPDGSVAFDLVTQANANKVSAQKYTVQLPALGYAFLRFGKDPAPVTGPSPIDTADSGAPQPGEDSPDGSSSGAPGAPGSPDDGDESAQNPSASGDGDASGQPAPGKPKGGKARGRSCSVSPADLGAPGWSGWSGIASLLALATALRVRRRHV